MIKKLIYGKGYSEEPTKTILLNKSLFNRSEQFAYRYYDVEGKGHNEFNLSLRINNANSLEITSQQITSMSGTETHRSTEKPETLSLSGQEINEYFDNKMNDHEIYGHTIWDSHRNMVKIIWQDDKLK